MGVREDRRGQELGRRLLRSAIDWAFDQPEGSIFSLNVGEERMIARRQYESTGFQLRSTGISLHKARVAERPGTARRH